MRTQIKRISIMQTSKVIAIIYPIFGLIHTMIGIWMLTSPKQPNWLGILFIFIPIILGILGFGFSVIGYLFYNFIASKVGSVEFILENVESE